ncbi:hypothetical protein BVY01_05215 [bacterium I07]|nr:hypothetical protein BVY01_05215 [bacterium I07]
MERQEILQSREEMVGNILKDILITENDDSTISDLTHRYDEGYVRNHYESVDLEKVIEKSSGVHYKGEVTSTENMVIIRYRTSIRDEGIAIWKRGDDLFRYHRWHDDLD